jgi:hypothetical protein
MAAFSASAGSAAAAASISPAIFSITSAYAVVYGTATSLPASSRTTVKGSISFASRPGPCSFAQKPPAC